MISTITSFIKGFVGPKPPTNSRVKSQGHSGRSPLSVEDRFQKYYYRSELVKANKHLSWEKIAKKYKISIASLTAACRYTGWNKGHYKNRKENILKKFHEDFPTLQPQGTSLHKWAKSNGFDPVLVYKYLKHLNIQKIPSMRAMNLKNGVSRCSRCKQLLPVDSFYRRSDGMPQCYCKKCFNERNALYAKKYNQLRRLRKLAK